MTEVTKNDKNKFAQPKQEKEELKFPTEIVDLPSKGLLYPESHPLSSGQVEMKYMQSKEEDILTSQNLIQKGVVIDRLLQSLIVAPKFDYEDLYMGDINALMIAARIMAYGKDYPVEIQCPNCNEKQETIIDLTEITDKEFDEEQLNRLNEFRFELPKAKKTITFKLPTQRTERAVAEELRFNKKIAPKAETKAEVTTRLKHMIIAVDDETDSKEVRKFVDNMLSLDLHELRKYINKISPDSDMTSLHTCDNCGHDSSVQIPMTVHFFWPDARA